MIFILNIKFKLLFDILKKKKFVIKADLNDFKTIIEVIIDRKINSSFLLDKQIKSKLFYLKRQWKSLVSRSSGPKYLKFKQMLETEFPIRLNQIDIAGNETEEKIQQRPNKSRIELSRANEFDIVIQNTILVDAIEEARTSVLNFIK